MATLTPMMQQYMEIKSKNKDCILFYRLGDFYEMFFEDAITASKELEITLTGKNCGLEEKAPMCGIPYHAVEGYLNKLVFKGYKVGICEQVEESSASRGIVKREVVRVVTPGTNMSMTTLDESKNSYLMSIHSTLTEGIDTKSNKHEKLNEMHGIAIADVTTGDFYVTEVDSNRKLLDEINKFAPREIVCNEKFIQCGLNIEDLRERLSISISQLEERYFHEQSCLNELKQHYHVATIEGLGLGEYDQGVLAAGSLMTYLYETQKNSLSHLTALKTYSTNSFMLIDSSTRRNLELTETLREKQKRGSLLWVLDKTKTAMGARTLRRYIEQPLLNKKEIDDRLDAIENLNQHYINREEIREYLHGIYDVERLLSKISYKTANPRDLISFKSSLGMLPHIKIILSEYTGEVLEKVMSELDPLEDLHKLIEEAIDDEPPISVRDGGIIKFGFNEEIDKYRKASTEGKQWIADLETRERERTGIKNLKIKYNKIFGYYLEVTNSYSSLVPEDYIRRQTVANAERYITDELKELEDTILGAEDKLTTLEYEFFCNVRDQIGEQIRRIQTTAKAIATIDALSSLALVAEQNGYVRPVILTNGIIDIKEGRHPVVEKMISNDMFISNDTYLDNKDRMISIITGPNMAGKSTYMRQVALIVLMAQIGSFVPAATAEIAIVDRIFTRVGASDDLASGQSTFMVEMTEVANILRNATSNSLLILDEIGRGTSTFDGMSIAWAVVEYISNKNNLGAKTLFATHYHELTELEGKLFGVNNYCIAVKEQGEDIVFLRKIIKGGADKSYGIQVAKIAGVPNQVIKRAYELVEELSDNDITRRVQNIQIASMDDITVRKTRKKKKNEMEGQMSLFVPRDEDEIILEIREMNINELTPVQAISILSELQTKIRNRF